MIIKFNLLPKKVEAKPEVPKEPFRFYKLIIATFILMLSLVITGVITLEREYRGLLKEKEVKEKRLKEVKEIAKRVEDMEKESNEIKKRIETVVALKKTHGEILRRLDTILASIGKNQIYFSSLRLAFNQTNIEGLSTDMESIGEYFKSLENKKDLVKQVNIKEVKKKDRLVEFQAEVIFY